MSGHAGPQLQVSPNIGDGHKMAPASLHCACIIALAAMVVGPTAQAADTVLTLACQGTTTSGVENAKPEPVSLGIIVNFTNRTVQGFGNVLDYPIKITVWNDVTVVFEGSSPRSITSGSIDRVTGDAEATSILMDATSKILMSTRRAEMQANAADVLSSADNGVL